MDGNLINNFPSTKSAIFMDGDLSAPNERHVSDGSRSGLNICLRFAD